MKSEETKQIALKTYYYFFIFFNSNNSCCQEKIPVLADLLNRLLRVLSTNFLVNK